MTIRRFKNAMGGRSEREWPDDRGAYVRHPFLSGSSVTPRPAGAPRAGQLYDHPRHEPWANVVDSELNQQKEPAWRALVQLECEATLLIARYARRIPYLEVRCGGLRDAATLVERTTDERRKKER